MAARPSDAAVALPRLPSATPATDTSPATRPSVALRVTMYNSPGPGATASTKLATRKAVHGGMQARSPCTDRPCRSPIDGACGYCSSAAAPSTRAIWAGRPPRRKSLTDAGRNFGTRHRLALAGSGVDDGRRLAGPSLLCRLTVGRPLISRRYRCKTLASAQDFPALGHARQRRAPRCERAGGEF